MASWWTKQRGLLLLLALALLAVLLWGPAPAAAASDFEDDEDEVEDVEFDLSTKAYEAAMASTDVWVVDYFQEECAACMQVKSFMEQLAKDAYPFGVKVGVFDMGQSAAAKKLGVAAGLVKLPALKIFVGPPEKNPYTGKMMRPSEDFVFQESAALDTKTLKRWVTKSVPNHVVKANAANWSTVLDAAFAEEGKGVVVTLTDRDSTPTLLKTMAIKYRGAYTFVEVPPSEAEFLGKFGVAKEDLSQLFVLPASKGAKAFYLDSFDLSAAKKYEGDLREPGTLVTFLDEHVEVKQAPAAAEAAATGKEGKGKGKEEGEGEKKPAGPPPYRTLNATNFKTEVYKDTDAWMVWFKPSADATSAEWDKHVGKAEGLLKLGAVDCSDPANAALCKAEGAAAFPFKAYPYGGDKEEEAQGFTKAEGAYAECGESVPDLLRRVGDGSNQMLIEQEMNAAFGSYKLPVAVITNKPEPALLFKALALKLEPFLHFFLVSSPSSDFLLRFNRAVVPSIHILVPQDPELYKDLSNGLPTQHALRIETFLPGAFGGMKFLHISNFFIQVMAQRVDPQKAQAMVAAITGDTPTNKGGASGAGGKPATVEEVTDAASWEAACPPGGARLCVLGLFRGGVQAPGVAEHVALLKEAAGKEGGAEAPWAFAWADGTCLTEFADAFDVQEPKLPTVVVYAPRKGRFANFKGTLSASAVSEFLRGILSGSIPVGPVMREPRVDADTSHCTGLGTVAAPAAAEAVVEEEEDIGDLMAEILAEETRRKEELKAELKREMEEEARKAAEAADAEPKKKIVRRKKKAASDEL